MTALPLALALLIATQSSQPAGPVGNGSAASAPEGAEAAPEGAASAPEGAASAPEGAASAPEGAEAAPEGAEAAPDDALATSPPAASSRPTPAVDVEGDIEVDKAIEADEDLMLTSGEDDAKPLRIREDILPWTSFATGLGLSLLGAVVAGVGGWPALSMLRAQVVLADVNSREPQEGDQSLVALRQAEIYDRNLLFQRAGAPVLGAGIGLMACGVLMVAGGIYTGVVMTRSE